MYTESIDLIFLDIHMPELSGIDFIKLLRGRAKIILTTAYAEYALEGYELSVIDYLLKPVSFERFLKAAQKAREVIEATTPQPAPSVTAPVATNSEDDHIFVKVDSRVQKVRFYDILYVEGLGNYLIIFTPHRAHCVAINHESCRRTTPRATFYADSPVLYSSPRPNPIH
jgi:DNA-binding LytR/AlgR family response regulator